MLKGTPFEAVEVLHPQMGAVFVLRGDLKKFGVELELVPQIQASILGVDVTFSPNTHYQYATRADDGMCLGINKKDIVFDLKKLMDKNDSECEKYQRRFRYEERNISGWD